MATLEERLPRLRLKEMDPLIFDMQADPATNVDVRAGAQHRDHACFPSRQVDLQLITQVIDHVHTMIVVPFSFRPPAHVCGCQIRSSKSRKSWST